MGKLIDNRKFQTMTEAEADDLYLRIARLKAGLDKVTAAHKAKIADLELAHKNRIAADVAEKAALEAELAAYILANPGRFQKPRKRPVGLIGTYGITTDPAYVEVLDKEALVDYALEQGYDDLYQVERTVCKDAVLRRIRAGEEIPGARVVEAGDVAKLSFRKGYAEALEK